MTSYLEDGFVVVPAVFGDDEVATWAAECDRLEASGVFHPDNLRTHVLNSRRPPDRLDPVIDLSPALASVAAGLSSLAAELLGEEAALFKDKLIFKPPGARGYLAHQDYAYWHWLPVPPSALVTVVVAVDAATADNGAVELFAGLHHRLLTEEGRPADIPDDALPAAGFLAETRAGDVVAFHSLTPHRSGDNRTARPRRQLFLSYAAARYGDLHDLYYSRLQASVLDGMDPGSARPGLLPVTAMDSFTGGQWAAVDRGLVADRPRAADSVLGLLRTMAGLEAGFPVDQLTHACQTAARAERAGASAELVVAALCHDVGKAVSWANHGAVSAEILRPYVADDVYQLVRWHQDFQARHFAEHLGGDPEARERHRGAPWFAQAEVFADEWDQASFDPAYDTPALDHFEPLVRAVFRIAG